jgi:hypothetical protein
MKTRSPGLKGVVTKMKMMASNALEAALLKMKDRPRAMV